MKIIILKHKQYDVQLFNKKNKIATTQSKLIIIQFARKRREYNIQQFENNKKLFKRKRCY